MDRKKIHPNDFTIFEYLYRDAANYKVWGQLLLEGVVSEIDRQVLASKFESGDLFIAEQLGIPALYGDLWEFSDGPTEDDHVWHTFHALRAVTPEDPSTVVFGSVVDLVARIEAVEEWKSELSPHCDV
jgi:hypothetical protein